MRAKRAVGVGLAFAALAAAPAQASTSSPEASVSERLEDRRAVAAGTRAQVLGFEDGRFYAQGWHTTGEMGGIVTPPLKLLDSVSFGVDGQWVGPATRFTSGWGYTRYDLPPAGGIRLQRTDFAPDRRRGALLGLTLTNPDRRRRTVTVKVDAHSELMTQYPWSSTDATPNASENAQDTVARHRRTLVFRDTGKLTGEERAHDYTAIVGSDRRPSGGETGPGHYGPFGAGRRCSAEQKPDPMPKECDDGPFGRGTGGQLRYDIKLSGHDTETLWIAVAGSENSAAEARAELARSRTGRSGCSSASARRAARSGAGRRSCCRTTRCCNARWTGASRTSPTSPRRRPGSTSAGPTRARNGRTRATCRASAGSARASPTTRGCSPPTASTPPTRA